MQTSDEADPAHHAPAGRMCGEQTSSQALRLVHRRSPTNLRLEACDRIRQSRFGVELELGAYSSHLIGRESGMGALPEGGEARSAKKIQGKRIDEMVYNPGK